MNLKPWDLDRMSLEEVRIRLDWIKHHHGIGQPEQPDESDEHNVEV